MGIVTLEQAKKQLNIAPDNTDDDEELQTYIDAAGGAVETHLHEVVVSRQVSERLTLDGSSHFRLWQRPVIELLSLTNRADNSTFDISGLDVDTDTGLVEVVSGVAPNGRYTATYQAGYATVPTNYQLGAMLILQHLWDTQRGTQGTVPGMAGADDNYDPRWSFSIPRRALELLGPPAPVVA